MTENINTIRVRYDGKDAEHHTLELHNFGRSAQGIARIIGAAGDFAITGNYQKGQNPRACKVLVSTIEPNCVSFNAI